MSQDALSDLLRSVRLRGALFFHIDCAGRWVTETPPSSVIAHAIMPDAEHVMEYHVMLKGSCWAGLVGAQAIHLEQGDVVVFPQGDAHVMSNTPGLRAEPDLDFLARWRPAQLPFMLFQEGDRRLQRALPGPDDSEKAGTAALLCGFLGCDTGPFNPLLAALPRIIHAPASAMDDLDWTWHFARLAAAESQAKRPGGEAVLERMSEMMFVDVIRRHLDCLPEHQTGWLAGLNDRYVGRALGLLHERPADAWTLDTLSRRVGLSRSALNERFLQFLGQPPMRYLANWRMQLASRRLIDGKVKLAAVALEVGYDSEAAFSRAFKRTAGLSPAEWRRQRIARRADAGSTAPSSPVAPA